MRKLTIEEIQQIAKSKGGILLSDKYINEKVKLKWQCSKGHIRETASGGIKSGAWCPKCYRIKRTSQHKHLINSLHRT